jgi:hypothetical protein
VKTEGRIFAILTVFFVLVSLVYWYLARDPIGTTALALCSGLTFLVGFYILYTSKRVYPRPEDRLDGEIDEADPEYGFYSPHSMGFATFLVVIGLIFAVWIVVFGVVILAIALVGWLFEYYRGDFAV